MAVDSSFSCANNSTLLYLMIQNGFFSRDVCTLAVTFGTFRQPSSTAENFLPHFSPDMRNTHQNSLAPGSTKQPFMQIR